MGLIFPAVRQLKYMRIPFKEFGSDFTGCDCGGLLRLVYREELGIELPDWTSQYTTTERRGACDLDNIFDEQTSPMGAFPKQIDDLKDVQPFDAVCMRVGPYRVHTGIVTIPGSFMHIQEGGTTVVERYDGLKWQTRLIGVFRHASQC